jgi:biotin synthase
MAGLVSDILKKGDLSREDIILLLGAEGDDRRELFSEAARIKQKYVGNRVYYRGLIEFSNICAKNCYYCGIRKGNREVKRYNLSDDEIVAAARFALDNNYGSIALQSGELESDHFTARITDLLKKIKKMSDGKLGITISLGEQTMEVYREWFEAGAHRYLLRIESSSRELYKKIHPEDNLHSFDRRRECLRDLQKAGYQTGTGVMIGLPFQTLSILADDLIFMRDMDIDMVGMGPYIEHENTPLVKHRDQLLPIGKRFDLSLKMIAVLRIVMKDINIAAATALQAIDPVGREKAIRIGANIIMPNITPGMYRNSYSLYENKPCTDEAADDCRGCLEARLSMADADIGYGEWGDSRHWHARHQKGRDIPE